jgi:hypothetical protein
MGRKASLKPDARGLFNRRIGWIEGEKYQPKIYLGRQEGPAVLGNARLETLWAQIEQRAGQEKVSAYWTEAMRTGQIAIVVEVSTETVRRWIKRK